MPAFFEKRDVVIAAGREASNVIRYHQAGTVSGWIEIEGNRVEVNPDEWYGFRDRSWGVREHVGLDPADLVPASVGATSSDKSGSGYHFNWLVSKIDRPDGTSYDLAYYFRDFGGDGPPDFFSGFINEIAVDLADAKLAKATVSRLLRRPRLRLAQLSPPPPVQRYERAAPGELIYFDIKKLARIERTGHRITGRFQRVISRQDRAEPLGFRQ